MNNIAFNEISDIEETYEGTKEFKSRKLHEVFRDKIVSYADPKGDGVGVSQSEIFKMDT